MHHFPLLLQSLFSTFCLSVVVSRVNMLSHRSGVSVSPSTLLCHHFEFFLLFLPFSSSSFSNKFSSSSLIACVCTSLFPRLSPLAVSIFCLVFTYISLANSPSYYSPHLTSPLSFTYIHIQVYMPSLEGAVFFIYYCTLAHIFLSFEFDGPVV